MKKVITLALALSAGSALAQDTVKVGVILPVSGVYAQLGEEGWKGFTLYMDSIGNGDFRDPGK